MDSDQIKAAVTKVNYITKTQDKNFNTSECQEASCNLLTDLVVYFTRAPTTAIALVQYLSDEGFDLNKLGVIYIHFQKKFSNCSLSENQLAQLRKISKKLLQS